MKYEKTVLIMGDGFDVNVLQVIYRECYLKISQIEFCELTGIKQPNLSAHEKLERPEFYDSVCAAFESLGFYRWLCYVATSPDELAMLHELADTESGSLYLTQSQWKKLQKMRKQK